VNVQIIQGAGHHVYADKRDNFNQLVLKACEMQDSEADNKIVSSLIKSKLDNEKGVQLDLTPLTDNANPPKGNKDRPVLE